MKVCILDYGIGNVGSVYEAFKFVHNKVIIGRNAKDIEQSHIIVLSGVGNFGMAKKKLQESGLWDSLHVHVKEKLKPVIGICLGMQLFSEISYEGGVHEGFGWLKGKVQKIEGENLRLPHIGWNYIQTYDNQIFSRMIYGTFYFMHSYHFVPEDTSVVIASTKYGNVNIVSAVKKENIVGFQFHPEKSQGDGLRLIHNTLKYLESCV